MSPPPALQMTNSGPASQLLENSWADSSSTAGFRPLQHVPSQGNNNWAMEFTKSGQLISGTAISHNQNLTPQQDCMRLSSYPSIVPNDQSFVSIVNRNAFSSQGLYGTNGGMYRPYGGMNMIGGQPQMMDKGKGKIRAEDFDAAFAQATALYQTESAKVEEVNDVTETLAKDSGATKQTTPASEDFKTWV